MPVVKHITGLPFRFGGEEHSGWLPTGAAAPLPTPVQDVLLTVEIRHESSGYTLYWYSDHKTHCGDSWHPDLADAEDVAREQFGINAEDWISPNTN